MEDGKITKPLLKTRSGEFDIESIHSLNLRDCGISDLGCISECSGLERLNISRNDITKLTKLAGLTNLHYLNLSANRITTLEGLQALESLHTLNLAGNLIGSIDSLRCLTGLDKLEELRLCDSIHGLSNPVCMNGNYKKDLLNMFPNLKVLDGERILGYGSDVFLMCRQIEEALEKRTEFANKEITRPVPWVSDSLFELSSDFENSNLADAEQQLQDLLNSCKTSVEKSEELFENLTKKSETTKTKDS